MIFFNCDYTEGAHPQIIQKLAETNMEQTIGYGKDSHCEHAAELIKEVCNAKDADVHFLVGGTQTNVTVIDSALRAHQGVICADSGHINVHETGAVEATGHKCITIPSEDGKVYECQVRKILENHYANGGDEHMAQPKMLYISNPTEWGTIYKKDELIALYDLCKEYGIYLFLDGARLGYGLMCKENDLTLADVAQYTDVFYIGGTKVGALFGEAVVITNPALKPDFRYAIKQHGGMLAKGRLLGIQFETLFQDGLYFEIAKHAMDLAERIENKLAELKVEFTVASPTNQIFVAMPKNAVAELSKKYKFEPMGTKDEENDIIRICTSWATKEENVLALLADIERVLS
jgi:threonine aldolase